ncbi:helix-turn-helix transcriptional regulator [Serratia marcescens]|jgi:putative transcriptional regulator|uniref:helix-turn-helix transcriptional regulator n=1 Tax=Serratia marcescens TaxID=615 RepID=UPI0018D60FA3|nr:helix-turn-helix transcriptional regulator [Serratia marcescens]MBH2910590.1 helix-turn-helix transcriptional regulator [Serratia marcescens]HCU0428852.1 helix-turn-helix transcriptional regulator [Serratia marcescens]
MNKLKTIRKSLRLTQAEVASAMGCKRSAIGHYESGRRSPDLNTCRKLVSIFCSHGARVGLDDLFPPSSELTKEIITDA